MFLKLKCTNGESVRINTSNIIAIFDDRVFSHGPLEIHMTPESIKELEENIFNEDTSQPRATEHVSTLLNDLHKLLGGRGEAKPTTDRKARLKARLKDFTEEELRTAARNLGNDEFMQGANENNKRYGTIDYLLRTSANVNKWLEDQPSKQKGMFG